MAIAPLSHEDLLPGEGIILRKNANAVIDVREAGLSRFAFDDLMWLVGMRGKEAIGGRVYLTNYRLVFKAHRFNRVRGTFSVFLPSIEEVRDSSFAVTRQATVSTATQDLTFVVWGVPQLIDTIDQCRAEFDDAYITELATLVLAEPWKIGHGLQTVARYEALNMSLSAARMRGDFSAAATTIANMIDSRFNRAEVAGALQVVDLLTRAGERPST
ncbi:hypothetical protein ACFVXW_27190 [Streptomyces sp. NPDC058251]|uniref:hypothetical protein n=1 Tax=Streptomyces sp. NPDC058251 TaxID=3346404 RepID=UPI0036E85D7A